MEWCTGSRFNWLDATRRRVIGDIMIHSVNIKSAKYIAEKVTPFGEKEHLWNKKGYFSEVADKFTSFHLSWGMCELD